MTNRLPAPRHRSLIWVSLAIVVMTWGSPAAATQVEGAADTLNAPMIEAPGRTLDTIVYDETVWFAFDAEEGDQVIVDAVLTGDPRLGEICCGPPDFVVTLTDPELNTHTDDMQGMAVQDDADPARSHTVRLGGGGIIGQTPNPFRLDGGSDLLPAGRYYLSVAYTGGSVGDEIAGTEFPIDLRVSLDGTPLAVDPAAPATQDAQAAPAGDTGSEVAADTDLAAAPQAADQESSGLRQGLLLGLAGTVMLVLLATALILFFKVRQRERELHRLQNEVGSDGPRGAGSAVAGCVLVAVLVLAGNVPTTAQTATPIPAPGPTAAPAAPTGAAATESQEGGGAGSDAGALLLIMDASGSMNRTDDNGQLLIDGAKTALRGLVDTLPDGTQVGLRVYGHRQPNTVAAEVGCTDTELISPVQALDRGALGGAIDAFQPSGYTPIGLSLQEGAGDLPAEGVRRIILVSDGEDTCAPPDPCQVAQDLVDQGIDITIETVGFFLQGNAAAEDQLRCIAETTGGEYRTADDAASLTSALETYSQRAIVQFRPTGLVVEGAPDERSAPIVEGPGLYSDTIVAGETRWYAIDVAPGQELTATVTVAGQTRFAESQSTEMDMVVRLSDPESNQYDYFDGAGYSDANDAQADRATTVAVRSGRAELDGNPFEGFPEEGSPFVPSGTYAVGVTYEGSYSSVEETTRDAEFPLEIEFALDGEVLTTETPKPLPSLNPTETDNETEPTATATPLSSATEVAAVTPTPSQPEVAMAPSATPAPATPTTPTGDDDPLISDLALGLITGVATILGSLLLGWTVYLGLRLRRVNQTIARLSQTDQRPPAAASPLAPPTPSQPAPEIDDTRPPYPGAPPPPPE